MISFKNLEPTKKQIFDVPVPKIGLECSYSVELTGFEIDLLCNLLSGRIASEFYYSCGVSNEQIEFFQNLQRRLGKNIGVQYV